jgi:hypothetical protein
MSAFRTLASTYLRRCALWWLPMLGVLIVFPCLIVWLVWCEAGTPGLWSSEADQLLASLQPPTFYVNFLYMMLIAGGAIAWGPLPDLFQKARISLLPVSNKTLGTFLWLLPACILMTFNLVVQHAYAWSFRNPWPILTTTICLGVLGTLLTALALWLRDFRFYKLPLAICAIGGWGYWYALHLYPNGFRKPPVLWDTFSSIDVVLLLAVAASSWQLTVAAFARYRCGEADFGQLLKYLDQPPYAMLSEKRSAVTLPPSQSAYSALLSLEWMKGRTIAITTAGILSCFFCLGLLAGIHDDRGKAITVLFPLIGMMYGVMSGLFLGIELCNAKNAQGEMKQFYTTLPFTDAELSSAVVKTCQRSAVLGSLILVGVAVLTIGCYSVIVEPIPLPRLLSFKLGRNGIGDLGLWGGALMMLGLPIAAWVVSGIMSAFLAVGRPSVYLTLTITGFVLTVTTILLPVFFGPAGQTGAMIMAAICLPLVVIVGTAVLFAIARNGDLIRSRDTMICGTIAATVILSICAFVPVSIPWKLIWCSAACLIVTPIAALPVALSSNRHR